MEKIHCQLICSDSPELSITKKWSDKRLDTMEQEISLKLINNRKISESEQQVMSEITIYYDKLFIKPENLAYFGFMPQDFLNFSSHKKKELQVKIQRI